MKLSKLTRNKWLTCALLVLSSLGIGVLSLCFAAVTKRWAMLASYFQNPLLLLLNLLPCVALCLFLWFLCGRAVVAYGITAAVVFGLTLANWYKLQFRDDPLLFGDLFLVQEAGNMLGKYSLFLTPSLAVALVLLLLGGAVLFFFGKGRLSLSWRRFALAAAVVVLAIPLSQMYTSKDIYSDRTRNEALINPWSATQVYTSKGFLYPFLYSVNSAFERAPEGYKKEEARAVLEAYEPADIPEGEKVNVMGVMLEAFNDFSKYPEIQFSKDVYQEFHSLEAESVSGNLITNIFAGGTVNTERAFLTGLAHQGSYRSRTNSHSWYFAEQGYTVTGSHPSYQWFYNRQNINRNLGFESYLFKEDHYEALALDGYIARDHQLFPELNRLYDVHQEESGAPYFSFSVTYQGHGPYNTEGNDWGENFVKPGVYTKTTENILNNYLGSVRSTAQALSEFVDHYREKEEPVVIVVFGDHNPWLGDGNSVYEELGLDLDTSEKQGFLNYYGTRYLIWANKAAKKVLGNDFTGKGPDISPNFLMNQVFRLCGWKGGAYMQYLDGLMEKLPVVHSSGACITAEGEFLPKPEGEEKSLLEEYAKVEYYEKTNFQYQETAKSRKDD